MVLRITEEQADALARDARRRLAARIAATAGVPAQTPRFEGYVEEAVENGVKVERHVAELALLLHQMDGLGRRPRPVVERLSDPEVGGELKVFQVRQALRAAVGAA